MSLPKPKFWVFAVLILIAWYYYEKHHSILTDSWDWLYEKATRGTWFVGVLLVLYVFFFQKGLIGKIFKSLAALDNDPRLNRVNSAFISPTGTSGDHRYPGMRTKHKRNVSALLKKKIAASQQWKCSSCNSMLDETYEVDHVLALDHGGTNDPSNLRALCPHCHRKKTVDERIFL